MAPKPTTDDPSTVVKDMAAELQAERERSAQLEATLTAREAEDAPAPDYHADKLRGILAEWAQPPASMLAALPRSTKKDNPKGRCNVCNGWHGLPAVHLDYMGHADVTEALIKADPFWNWRPAGRNPDTGAPIFIVRKGTAVMWGYLTVLGVERPCVGTAPAEKEELEKELIGDLLRNGALRFGVAVRLWSKADHLEAADDDAPAPPAAEAPAVDTNAGARHVIDRAERARQEVADQADAAHGPTGPADLPASSSAAPPKADPTPAGAGPGATELAAIATTGPLKTRALRAARDVAAELAVTAPSSFEDLLAGPDYLAAGAAEKLAAHLANTSRKD